MTRVTAVRHGPDNIRANCIAPGHLGREGDAWDVGWAALFLASAESRWISGIVLPIDGGLLAVYDNLV